MRVSVSHGRLLQSRVTGDPEIVRATRTPALVLLDQGLGGSARERAVELVVDLHHRREVARRDALDLFDADVGVVGVAALQVVEEVGPPFTRQLTLVHTDTSSFPTGARLNIV